MRFAFLSGDHFCSVASRWNFGSRLSHLNLVLLTLIRAYCPLSLSTWPVLVLLSAGVLLPVNTQAATRNWTGAVSGDWFTPENWTPSGVPDASDSVTIFEGKTVALPMDARVAGLIFDQATLSGVGTLTIIGAATWTAGTLSGNLIVAGGLTLNGTNTIAASGRFELAGGILSGTNRITGPGLFVWSNGKLTGDVTVDSSATMNVAGFFAKTLDGGKLINEGQVIWTDSGPIYGANNGEITNKGVFEMRNDAGLAFCCEGQIATFANTAEGTIRKTQTTGQSVIGGFFLINRGRIDIQSGTLRLTGIKHRLENGGRFSGAGLTLITTTGARLEGTSKLEAGARLELSGVASSLEGTAILEGPGTFVWSGGELQNQLTISKDTQMLLNGNDKALRGAVLNNSGTVRWTDFGGIRAYGGTTINNAGLFEVSNDADAGNGGGDPVPRFHNLPGGTFRKLASTGQTIFSGIAFDNDGLVEVLTGNLILAGGGTSGGRFINAPKAVIDFRAGNMVLDPKSEFVISGTNRVTAPATLTLNGTHTIAAGGRFELAGGTLAGTSRITGPGLFVWSLGSLTGEVTVDSSATMNVVGGFIKVLYGNLINEGHVIWTDNEPAAFYGANNGAITNKGVFEMRNDAVMAHCCGGQNPTFVNTAEGTIRKTQSTGQSGMGGFLLINRGIIDIQSGTLKLAGPLHRLENGGHFSGAGLTLLAPGQQASVRMEGTSTLEAGARLEFTGTGGILNVLEGTATLEGPGTFIWSGGELRNELTISQDTQMRISGDTGKTFWGNVLNNYGRIVWTGSGIGGALRAVINNYGLFEARNDQSLFACCEDPHPTFNNFPDGTFRKVGSSGQTDVSSFVFNDSGKLSIESGTFRLPDIILFNGIHVPWIIQTMPPLPDFQAFSATPTSPIRSNNYWHFGAQYRGFVPGLRIRVQSTLTPKDELSWIYLPGGGQMIPQDTDWTLDTTDVPIGVRFFRANASASGYIDHNSLEAGPVTVLEPDPLPDFRSFSVNFTSVPIFSNNQWMFRAGFSAQIPDLRIRIQSTLTSSDESSWEDLPRVWQMSHQDAVWSLDTTDIPTGDHRYFRALASAPGYHDRAYRPPAGPYEVFQGIGPFGDFTYRTTAPTRTGTRWTFTISQPSTIAEKLRLQSSSTPEIEDNWVDLPAGEMTRQGSLWSASISILPTGIQAFRVVASATNFSDRVSAPLGTFDIQAAREEGEINLDQPAKYRLAEFGFPALFTFVKALGNAVVQFFTGPENTPLDTAVAVSADPGSSVQVEVAAGESLTIPGISIGADSVLIIQGTINGSCIVATDGATIGLLGGKIVATDGATIVAGGGGNVIAGGAGNIVAGGGGNIVAGGGGNIVPGGGRNPTRPQSPSSPAFTGLMTINGSFQLGVGGALAIAIAGTNTTATGAQEYDQLIVNGRADLGGVIGFGLFNPADVTERTNVFSPPLGATFDLVVASNIVTHSLIVRGPIWGNGLHVNWNVVNRADGKQALRLVAVPIAPPLFIQRAGAKLQIQYPTNFVGYVLQSSRNLASTNWTDVSANTPRLEINATNSAEFFRLLKQ
jgi:hypothetical protein